MEVYILNNRAYQRMCINLICDYLNIEDLRGYGWLVVAERPVANISCIFRTIRGYENSKPLFRLYILILKCKTSDSNKSTWYWWIVGNICVCLFYGSLLLRQIKKVKTFMVRKKSITNQFLVFKGLREFILCKKNILIAEIHNYKCQKCIF